MGTGFQPRPGRGRARCLAATVSVALIAAAVLVAGCGSSSSASSHAADTSKRASVPKVSAAELARAADVSTNVAGFKLVMSMHETAAGTGAVSMTGSGSFQTDHVGSLSVNMSLPAGAADGLTSLQMTILLDHEQMYMQLPSSLASEIPGGKPWLEFDFSKLGNIPGASALSSLMDSSSQLSDPSQYFEYLRAAAAGSLRSLGTETVDGFQTTHYHADISLSKLPDAVPAAQRPAIEQLIAEMSKSNATLATIPVDVWIDSNNLIRRIILTESLTLQGKPLTVDIQEDIPEYGPQPAPGLPAASEVTNLSTLLSGLSSNSAAGA